jgi:hypothetical protein
MRSKIALAGLAVGIASAVLPVSHASAYCMQLFFFLTGHFCRWRILPVMMTAV